MDGKQIVKRWERMESRDSNFRNTWRRLAPFVEPTRYSVLAGASIPGQNQVTEVFDSTSNSAVGTHASFVFGKVINPAVAWMRYKIRQKGFEQHDEVNEWRDEITRIFLDNLGSSNFYLEAHETLIDHVGFGTNCLHMEALRPSPYERPDSKQKRWRGFNFRAYKIGTFAVDEDSQGKVDTRYCCYTATVRALAQEFGEEGFTDEMRRALQTNEDQIFEVVHAIQPRPASEQNSMAAKSMPWGSYYVEKKSGKVLKESGYKQFPDAVARYAKTPGEVYGRSPSWLALPEVLSLNKIKYDEFEAVEMANKPPLMAAVEMGGLGTIQLFPGGFNTIKLRPGMTDVRNAIAPLETGRKAEFVQLKEEEIRRSIERIYLVDVIRQLIESDKAMTAFEYAQKLSLVMQLMGPVFGRLQEWLNAIADIGFEMLWEAGQLPPPPDVLMEREVDIDVEYEGPLAKAQRAGEVDAINQYAQGLLLFSQLDPNVVHMFKSEKAARVLADVLGTPAVVLPSEDEYAQLMQAVTSAKQQETQKEDMLASVKALSPVATKLLPTSPTTGGLT